jgi:hypothetical protein
MHLAAKLAALAKIADNARRLPCCNCGTSPRDETFNWRETVGQPVLRSLAEAVSRVWD